MTKELDVTKPMRTKDGRKAEFVRFDDFRNDYPLWLRIGNAPEMSYTSDGFFWSHKRDCYLDVTNIHNTEEKKMSIKVELNEKKEREFTYPFIGKRYDNLIVLFLHQEKGSVLQKDYRDAWSIAAYSEDWDMSDFKKLEGSITLSNQ